MIRIHKEGRWMVVASIIMACGIFVAGSRFLSPWLSTTVSILAMAQLVLILRFFRNPGRRPFRDERSATAPADGKIVAIEKMRQDEFLGGECIQVSIFMSIHNVHINYFPVDGKVAYVKYHPGKYLLARHPKSSALNERYSVGIETPYGPILVRQVAGYVARRIRCYAAEGRSARQGKEMGFIKFGSRLDLFLPCDARILVELDQKVMGGLTPIARFAN